MAPAAPLRGPPRAPERPPQVLRTSSTRPPHVLRTPYTRLTHEWFPDNVARNLGPLTFLRGRENRMIPTIRFQILKYSQGNYVQLFWGELTKGQHEAGAEQHKLGTTGGTTRGQAHRHPPITPKPPQPTHPPSQPRPRDTHAQLGPTGGAWATPPTPPPKGLTCASKGPGTHPSGPSNHSQHIHQASHGLVALLDDEAATVTPGGRRPGRYPPASPDAWRGRHPWGRRPWRRDTRRRPRSRPAHCAPRRRSGPS